MPEKSGKLDFFNPLKALYRAVTAIHGKSQKIKLLLFASFWQSMNCLLRMECFGYRCEVFITGMVCEIPARLISCQDALPMHFF
jgi:hypothetical protein